MCTIPQRAPWRWLLGLLLALATLTPDRAAACGGCFSPSAVGSATGAPVLQRGERVLFARDPKTKTSHAWIEIRYSGLAKSFAWVVPLPKKPKKVGVGTSYLFNRLDLATAPRYRQEWTGELENCHELVSTRAGGDVSTSMVSRDVDYGGGCSSPSSGSAYGTTFLEADAGSSVGSGMRQSGGRSGVEQRGGVTIVEQDQAGPYDWAVIEGKDPKAMGKWLAANGFAVPGKADAIIASHVAKGDVFLAVKLSQGKAVNEIRPLTLELDDTEACVPLRLTSIAATENLTVLAYVAGEGRAIPKNYMHVVVNPLRLTLAGQLNNYAQVLAEALDEAGGRAFTTEFAGDMAEVSVPGEYTWERRLRRDDVHDTGAPIDPTRLSTTAIAKAKTASQLIAALGKSGFPITADTVAVLDAGPQLAAKVSAASDMPNATNAVWLYSRLAAGRSVNGVPKLHKIPVDGAGIAAKLQASFVAPLLRIHGVLAQQSTLTRLAMTISPDEMTRDPIFAFNPKLPDIPAERRVVLRGVCSDGWVPHDKTRLTYLGSELQGSWVLEGSTTSMQLQTVDKRFQSAPAALRREVLPETGAPVRVGSSQISLVDTALDGAVPGKPSLPPGLVIYGDDDGWTPPPDDPEVTELTPWHRKGSLPLSLPLLTVMAMIGLWRRRRS